MATKKQEGMTRAQKTEATKGIIKELLAIKFMRHNELIDEVAKLYIARYEGEDTDNINDVRGRVGSVLDIMQKESEVAYDGGMYALKSRLPMPPPEKAEPVKKPRARKKAEPAPAPVEEAKTEEPAPVKKTRTRKKADPAPVEEKPAPVEKQEEKTEEPAPAPKKRGRKPKAVVEEKTEEKVEEKTEEKVEAPTPVLVEEKKEEPAPAPAPKAEEKKEERTELIVAPKAEVAKKGVVMDMSFLFGDKPKAAPAPVTEKKAEKPAPIVEKKVEKPAPIVEKKVEKPAPAPVPAPKAEVKPEVKTDRRVVRSPKGRLTERVMTAEEKLKDAFLKKLRSLGGDYFEYYSVYLLERYSMRNGRRLEGLRISGGDHDGGIDGEIELTDRMGFKETIYIQSKNWNPEKGKEENWVVGETLLQQFIGACACRQAKDGKQHTRGIFVTTSRFTPDAKRILEDMSEKIVGYDGNDLYEAAKECEFGLVKKNGEWSLDERLLSGTKAFFQML